MFAALLVSSVILGAPPADEGDKDRAAYEAARAQAGRDPEAHIRLALWCEAHGLKREWMKHLAIAVLTDPKNAMARGLMGMVAYNGQWQRPEAVAAKVEADGALKAKVKEYQAKRAKAADTAEAQWRLALWCEENGLNAEATAHLRSVVRLDPSREAAWKRLGFKKQNGRWATPTQLAEEKAELERQKQADHHWKPLLEKWRGWLGDNAKREKAQAALQEVVDPRAVPMVWLVFASGGTERQKVAVQVLGQIDAPGASRALAMLSLFSRSAEVRRTSAETLLRRDPREFAGLLVGFLREPIKYEVRKVGGPGSPGELYIQGKKVDYRRRYSPLSVPNVMPNDRFAGFDDFGLPLVARTQGFFWTPEVDLRSALRNQVDPHKVAGILAKGGMEAAQSAQLGQLFAGAANSWTSWLTPLADQMAPGLRDNRISFLVPVQAVIPVGQEAVDAARSAQAAEQKLEQDVRSIDAHNAPVRELNGRVRSVLAPVAGQDLGEDLDTWRKWLTDLMGFALLPQAASQDRPTVIEDVPINYQPQAAPVSFVTSGPVNARISHSCFAAGTPVRTLTGDRAIESIRAGDQVLSQDTASGTLVYRPVVTVYHNPPNRTLRVTLGDESVVATGIHRFWKAGKGWTMARELKTGDMVRTLGGSARVTVVEDDKTQPVFNLELADGDSFFVGRQGALVHDNSVVRPVMEPFDAPPALPVAGR